MISVPNVGYWPVVGDLANGRFEDTFLWAFFAQSHLQHLRQTAWNSCLMMQGLGLVDCAATAALSPNWKIHAAHWEFSRSPCDRNNLGTESLHALARIR